MPGMSGLEVCRRLRDPNTFPRRHSPQPPISACYRQIDVCAVTTDLADWQVSSLFVFQFFHRCSYPVIVFCFFMSLLEPDPHHSVLSYFQQVGMHWRADTNGVIGKPLKEHDLHHALQLVSTSVPSCPSVPQLIPAEHATYPVFFFSHGLHRFVWPLALSESTSRPRPTPHFWQKDHPNTSTATIVPTRNSLDGDWISYFHPNKSPLLTPMLGRRTLIQRLVERSQPGLTRVDSRSSTNTGTSLSECTSLEALLMVTVSGPKALDWSRWV